MAQLSFADQARLDLDDIWFYISQRSPAAADQFIDEVREKCRMLAENPLIGQTQEYRRPNVRKWPVGSYLIFYRTAGEGIEVIRVLHGSRDIDSLI